MTSGHGAGRGEQVDRIHELARQGLTPREIAARCGITPQRAQQVITGDPRLHTQWRVASMRAAGATLAQIAAALGVTGRTVSRHVTALGLAHHGPAHGTSRRYDEGCGCEQCTEAHRVAAARNRDRQRQRGTRPSADSRELSHLDAIHAADQARTRAAATRAGRTWTGGDLAVALDPRLTTTQAAERLGRSRAAVQHIRARNPGWRTR